MEIPKAMKKSPNDLQRVCAALRKRQDELFEAAAIDTRMLPDKRLVIALPVESTNFRYLFLGFKEGARKRRHYVIEDFLYQRWESYQSYEEKRFVHPQSLGSRGFKTRERTFVPAWEEPEAASPVWTPHTFTPEDGDAILDALSGQPDVFPEGSEQFSAYAATREALISAVDALCELYAKPSVPARTALRNQ
jgi:hypothetical protein